MDQEFERALLRRWFALREARTTSMIDAVHREPTANYTDRRRFDSEATTFFSGRPRIVGLSCDLPSSGEFFTAEVGDVPVLVVRGEDGYVRAFLNVCRHRGSRVADGRGHPGRVFKCPYHAWTYDINGQLLGQPSARNAFDGVDATATGLIPLPAAEVGGLILVRPAAGDEPIDTGHELAGLASEIAALGLEDFSFYTERQSTWEMNWKQPYDSFLEAYHIFSLHRESLSKEVLSTPMLCDAFGPHGRGLVMSRAGLRLLDRDESEWTLRGNGNLVYWLFPNTVLNLPAPGHVELWQFYPADNDPGRTRVHVRFYTPRGAAADTRQTFWDRMVEFTMGFVDEDFIQQATIFANLRAGVLPELIFGRNEPALVHYHRALDSALAATASTGEGRTADSVGRA
jgi:phenylpropionate dioxygenase-like ring-hydroxylating dioxygenase large terminal subunit